MPDALSQISTRATPQTQRARPDEVANSAGGYVFATSDDVLLHRFLTLGTEGGTYYISEPTLTAQTAGAVLDMARRDAAHVAKAAAQVSQSGRAPRNNPALFALAAATALGSTDAARHAAYERLPDVARTATHLFTFLGYRRQFAGVSAGLRRAVGRWYLERDPDVLAYQLVKYRQRDGWTHRDVLRMTHPGSFGGRRRRPTGGERLSRVPASHRELFDWVCGRRSDTPWSDLPGVVTAFDEAQAGGKADWLRLITADGSALSWEMLPDQALTDPEVWSALLNGGRVPQTALLRQLPRLTRIGVFRDRDLRQRVTGQLVDLDRLQRARVHPVNVLIALRTYAAGRSEKSSSVWAPDPQIIDALDEAFYVAYGAVEPANTRQLLAVDVSGSMGEHSASGLPLTCREAAAAMALVTMGTERDTTPVAFTNYAHPGYGDGTDVTPLALSGRQRLDDAVRLVGSLPFGGTDCSLPMRYAQREKLPIDTFVIYCADEETEILTGAGWQRFDQVQPGHEVYTLNHDTGLGEWQPATAVSVFPATRRRMLRMEGRSHSSLTTLDHRWPVRHRRSGGAWGRRWKTSATLNSVDYIQCAAMDSGLPGEPKFSDAFVELMGWTWTEGHITDSGALSLCQSGRVNADYCARIDTALRAVFGPPTEQDMRTLRTARVRSRSGTTRSATPAWRYDTNAKGITYWHLNQAAAAPLTEHMTAVKAVRPDFLRSLTRAQLELFIATSMAADGWHGRMRLAQKSKLRADAFQVACVLAGYPTSLTHVQKRGSEAWEVGILQRDQLAPVGHASNPDGRSFVVEEVDHDGIVWCPTTPNGTWLARRRGTVYWTGNTDNESWAGPVHPWQALRAYRESTGIPARLVVVALTATNLSITDPTDPLQLDVAGMDKNLPGLLADFSAGRI